MKLGSIVRKLRLSNNTLIAIKKGSELADTGVIDGISQVIRETGFSGVVIVVVDDLHNIETISEQTMSEYGWLKISRMKDTLEKARSAIEDGKEKNNDQQ